MQNNNNDGWKNFKPAKTKKMKRNLKRMQNGYFEKQYNAYGENFTNFKTSRDIEFESNKIFRDLANGLIDYEKHGKAFEDNEFVEVLRNVAYKKMLYHDATCTGLNTYITYCQYNGIQLDNYIYTVCGEHMQSLEAYRLLFQAFSNILISHDYVAELARLMPMLNPYRNSL